MHSELSFSSGASIDRLNLVALRRLAARLPLSLQQQIFNELSGRHRSGLRGRGMDFSDVRQYQAGDDLRTMDWRITARTHEPQVKVFHEERERPVLIACDLRATMHFGSRRAFKSVLAADLAALLAWAVLDAGDRIGALLFNDQVELDLRPKAGAKAVLRLISELSALPKSTPVDHALRLEQVFRHLRRIMRPGSRLYVLSDFAGFNAACEQHLHHVVRHSDVIALQISDPLERQLPPPGLYPISDGTREGLINSLNAHAREDYQQAFLQQQTALSQTLRRLQVPLIALSTDDEDPLTALRAGLGIHDKGRKR